jgi:hypothetical protein
LDLAKQQPAFSSSGGMPQTETSNRTDGTWAVSLGFLWGILDQSDNLITQYPNL